MTTTPNASDTGPTGVPDVSVVVPAHNAMPYLLRCLQSVVDQTISQRIEAIFVNDGSTDGTGEELDRWAEQYPDLFRVVHQAASGGPAGPRNVALDIARGRYIFFLDADDYLGTEALERLVRTADDNESDVVLGKMTNDGNRGVPQSMFRESTPDADLFSSRVYWTVSVLKLYRRSMIEDNALRFPTQFPTTSDQPFAGLAYLRARKISVNADYDYYYVVRRDDGGHVTQSGNPVNRIDVYEWMCDMLAREVPDLARREYLLSRHFQIDLRRIIFGIAKTAPPMQRELFERLGPIVRRHLTPGVAKRLQPSLATAYRLAGESDFDETVAACQRLNTVKSLGSWSTAWESTDLVVDASLGTESIQPMSLVLAKGKDERLVPMSWNEGRLSGRIDVTSLPSGAWSVRVRVGVAPAHIGQAIPAPEQPTRMRWNRPLRASAVLHGGAGQAAVLDVDAVPIRHRLRRRLAPLKQRFRR